jgi:hypothetical protein
VPTGEQNDGKTDLADIDYAPKQRRGILVQQLRFLLVHDPQRIKYRRREHKRVTLEMTPPLDVHAVRIFRNIPLFFLILRCAIKCSDLFVTYLQIQKRTMQSETQICFSSSMSYKALIMQKFIVIWGYSNIELSCINDRVPFEVISYYYYVS